MSNADRKKQKAFSVKFSVERLAEFTVATRRRGISRASIIQNAVTELVRKESAIDPEGFAQEVEAEIKLILKPRRAGRPLLSWKEEESVTAISKGEGTKLKVSHGNGDQENTDTDIEEDDFDDDDDGLPELPRAGRILPSPGEDDAKNN